jgi:dUTP pyrophosphatase
MRSWGKEEVDGKVILDNESVLLATGLKFIFPFDCVMEIKNRSGIASKKGLIVGACIVDSTYRGEVFVNLHNISGKPQIIEVGERIAQFVVYKVENCLFDEVTEEVYNSNESSRNDGGFGSTGHK